MLNVSTNLQQTMDIFLNRLHCDLEVGARQGAIPDAIPQIKEAS